MGNISFTPILGHGSTIISLNRKLILIWHCPHVPDLRNPLYSLRAYQCQHGCGYIGMYGLGMYVFFLLFILEVDTATDWHLQYEPIGCQTTLDQLDYVQPKFSCAPSATMAKASSDLPTIIEPVDENTNNNSIKAPTYTSHWPKKPPVPSTPTFNLAKLPPPAYSIRLKDFDWDALIQRLYTLE
jgi:hypothetical protein